MKKKNIYLLLLMALVVMSCSENETIERISHESGIDFGIYTSRTATTRGVEMDLPQLKTDAFGVLAYYTNQNPWLKAAGSTHPNFMYNQQIKWDSTLGEWTYSPIRYWPNNAGAYVSFFAYAPYNNSAVALVGNDEGDTGTPTITFTVADEVCEMVDFVTAVAIDKTKAPLETATNSDAAKVVFNFKHELSRVAFKAKPSEQLYLADNDAHKTYINIKSAVLSSSTDGNFYKQATYTFPNENDTEADDNFVGTWDYTNALTFSSLDIDNLLATDKALFNIVGDAYRDEASLPIEGVMIGDEANNEAVSIFGKNELDKERYLFFIPASTVEGGGLGDGAATVTFEYDIVTIDNNLVNGYSCTSAVKTVNLPKGTLRQGTAYTYTFIFNVDRVEVKATVIPWKVGGQIIETLF